MLKRIALGLLVLITAMTASAEDTSRDDELVRALDPQTIRFIAESLGHRITLDFEGATGTGAVYTDKTNGQQLTYGLQGKVCPGDTDCLGLEVYVLFYGTFASDTANEINRRYAAIKATIDAEENLYLSRYLILDKGQTIGNIRTNVQNTLAIAQLIQGDDKTQAKPETVPSTQTADPVSATQIAFGDDSGAYANDGACDDARFFEDGDQWSFQRSHVLRDATDCQTQYEAGNLTVYLDFGDNSGDSANDQTCDDGRFVGESRSVLKIDHHIKKDAADCIAAYQAGLVSRK